MPISKSIYGRESVPIPFPDQGPWMSEGQSRDLGAFRQGMCSGNLFKQADNHLYVSLHIMTCGDIEPIRIPLGDREYGPHILDICWEEAQVRRRRRRRRRWGMAPVLLPQ